MRERITSQDPDAVFDYYVKDSHQEHKKMTAATLVTLFSHVAERYLSGKIDEWVLGAFSTSLYSNGVYFRRVEAAYPRVASLIAECVDISWVSRRKGNLELRKKLQTPTELL